MKKGFIFLAGIFSILFSFSASNAQIIQPLPIPLPPPPQNINIISFSFFDNEKGVAYTYRTQELQGRQILSPSTEYVGESTFVIYGGSPQFYFHNDKWYQVEYATTTAASFINNILPNLSAQKKAEFFIKRAYAQTIFPQMDGFLSLDGKYTWSEVVNGNTASSTATAGIDIPVSSFFNSVSMRYSGRRGVVNFDTSSISGVVSSSTLVWVATSTPQSFDGAQTAVTSNTIVSDTLLSNSDWPLFGNQEYCDRIAVNTLTNGKVVTCGLNAAGLSHINVDGSTHFAFRINKDVDNVAPLLFSGYGIMSSENTGTSQDPQLVIISTTTSVANLATTTATSACESQDGVEYCYNILSVYGVYFLDFLAIAITFVLIYLFFKKRK